MQVLFEDTIIYIFISSIQAYVYYYERIIAQRISILSWITWEFLLKFEIKMITILNNIHSKSV